MSVGAIEIIIALIVIAAPISVTALIIYSYRSAERRRVFEAARERELQERTVVLMRRRGSRITELIEKIDSGDSDPKIQPEIYRLLRDTQIGPIPDLTAPGGWFDRVRPTLRQLARTPPGAQLIEDYFRCFAFGGDQQAKALEFLANLLRDASTDDTQLKLFTRVATVVLTTSTPTEARWLYDKTLDAVTTLRGAPAVKSVALSVGRSYYAALRPDKQLTLYDEQAIANDIAVRAP